MQAKLYVSGITVRQARVLRWMVARCGGCRFNVIRLVGTHHATFDLDIDGPRAKALAELFINPPRRWIWATRQAMLSYHH